MEERRQERKDESQADVDDEAWSKRVVSAVRWGDDECDCRCLSMWLGRWGSLALGGETTSDRCSLV